MGLPEPKISGDLDALLVAEMELRKTLVELFDASSSGELKVAVAGRCAEAVQRIKSLQKFLAQWCPSTVDEAPLGVYDAADEDFYWEDLRRR